MRLLINFSTLKKGGGQNVAMNFLHGFDQDDHPDMDVFFWVAKGSAPHKFLSNGKSAKFITFPQNPVLRIILELTYGQLWILLNKIDVIYTYFGYALVSKKFKQVSGSADSNLYYPEVDFWSSNSGVRKFLKVAIDTYRLYGVKSSKYVIFENEDILNRARTIHGVINSCCIKPSISSVASYYSHDYRMINKNSFSCLFLCGWHMNKNILLMPKIASEFKRFGVDARFYFTTCYDGSEISNEFESLVTKLNVSNSIFLIGNKSKDELPGLFDSVDFVFLLSELESFSNNIIESWYYKRPLVVSDKGWARSLCGESAIYVERDDEKDIVKQVMKYVNDENWQISLRKAAEEKLKSYPTIKERINQEFELLERVHRNG